MIEIGAGALAGGGILLGSICFFIGRAQGLRDHPDQRRLREILAEIRDLAEDAFHIRVQRAS